MLCATCSATCRRGTCCSTRPWGIRHPLGQALTSELLTVCSCGTLQAAVNLQSDNLPSHCAGVGFLKKVPAQYLRAVNFVLICIAFGCFTLAVSLFGARWHANNKHSQYSSTQQKVGHAPWSFLSGALSAFLSAGKPLSSMPRLQQLEECRFPSTTPHDF